MCKICEEYPVYEFTNKRKLCKNCFIKYFQKKALYIIRKFNMILEGDAIYYKKNKDVRGVVLEDILKMYSEKAFVNLVLVKNKKYTKIDVSDSLDLNSVEFIKEIIEEDILDKKVENFLPVCGNVIKPLFLFSDKEILLYAKIRNLIFKPDKQKFDKIILFVNDLEKKHPEIKQAVLNSYLKLFG